MCRKHMSDSDWHPDLPPHPLADSSGDEWERWEPAIVRSVRVETRWLTLASAYFGYRDRLVRDITTFLAGLRGYTGEQLDCAWQRGQLRY